MLLNTYSKLKPHHINADKDDLAGNNNLGRYIFLCGSSERASVIADRFDQRTIKKHSRGHDLHLGTIRNGTANIDVASISMGMGSPSADIILNELFILGAKRFLRIGTSGSLQPHLIKVGDVVIATGAVRDESTSSNYITRDFPAIASHEITYAAMSAATQLELNAHTHAGIVHSKDSFYAREVKCSFLRENIEYMEYIKKAGVLASEMECSILFTLASIIGYQASNELRNLKDKILAGAILAVIGDNSPISASKSVQVAIDRAIEIGFETFKLLHKTEINNCIINTRS